MGAPAGRNIYRGNPLILPGTKPGFDRSHFAAPNTLISAVAMGGGYVDLLTGVLGPVSGTGYTSGVKGIVGQVGTFANNTNKIAFPTPTTITYTSRIVATICISPTALGGTAGANQYVCGDYNNAQPGSSISFSAAGINAIESTSGSVLTLLAAASVALNTPYFIAFSCRPNFVNFAITRLDTGQIWTGAPSASGLFNGSVSGNFNIGNRSSDSARPLMGSVAAGMLAATTATSQLSIAQLRAWASDPWAFWYPQADYVDNWVVGAAAAAATPFGFTAFHEPPVPLQMNVTY